MDSISEENEYVPPDKMNRHGCFWTSNEEGLILLRLAEGKSPKEISVELKRSKFAVECRRDVMIVRLFRRGRSCAYLSRLFQVSVYEVERAIRYPISPNCL